MIRFLYTGATENLGEQIDPERSLGGFVSKTIIPNRKNNLFQDISYLTMRNETEEFRAIIIENKFNVDLNNVKIGYLYDKRLYDIEIALVELNEDGKMEMISNSRSQPYYAEFFDASITPDQDDSFDIEVMTVGQKFGIWVKRKVKQVEPQEEPIPQVNFEFIIKYDE